MIDINEDINVSLYNAFYNRIMKIKENKISEYISQQEKDIAEINLNNEKHRAYIINLCFDNIINSNNYTRNYIFVNILLERGYINKNFISQDKLSKLYNKFTNNFISKKDKEKGVGLNIKLDMNKEDSLSTLEKSDLPNINLQIRFLAKIYYFYSDKKTLIEFIKKEILDEKIIDNKSVIIKEFLNNKNNFENLEFIIKEEADLYIDLFLKINYLENRIEYIFENNLKITNINQEILYIKEFWNIFNIQKNQEIINEMCEILYQLYNTNNKDYNIKQLFIKCKDIFQYNLIDNINIIHLMKYIIIQTEKDCVIKIKPHYLLCKKNAIKINYEEKKEEIKDLYFFGNSSINQICQYLTKKNNTNNVVYYINNNIINEKEQNKSLNEFDKMPIKISKKEIDKNVQLLINEGKLTPKFVEILENWFYYFSKGSEKMARADLAECFNILSGKNGKKFTENSIKIWMFLKKYSNNLEFISLDKFINYYYYSITEGNKEAVWKNIENMNLRNDLNEIPKIKENKFLPRYYLSNETKENKDIYLMDIFKQKYKNSLNKDLYNFIFFLSTEEKMYDYILKNFNTAENMKFTKRKDEYLYNLYIMNIIESILDDIEYLNDNNIKFKEIQNLENEYYLYKPENKIREKNEFFKEFLQKNYSDLIDYGIKNLQDINKIENKKIDLQSRYVAIKLYKKNIELINRIYNYYFNIYFVYKKDEIIFGKNSLKELIESYNLSKEINDQKNYKDLFFELMKFFDIYYIADNKNQEIIQGLIDNSFYLFISLLFKNKAIYEDIENDSEKKVLLNNIFSYILTSNKQKNKHYITNLLKINSYIEEIHLYLIDLSFTILTTFEERKFETLIVLYISNNLWGNAIGKDNLKKKLKEKILSVLFNSFNDNIKNNKSSAFIQVLSKFLENQKQFKDELMESRYNKIILYDLIYDKIYKKEEEKLKKKYEKFDNFKNILLSKNDNDKFILYDFVKKKLEEIFNSQNNINNDKEQNQSITYFLMTIFKSYNMSNTNNKKIIGKTITSLQNLIKIEENRYNNNKGHKENNKKIKKTCPYVGIKNLGSLCYLGSIMQQLYWISKFKYSILSADDSKPPDKSNDLVDDDDNILHQTQKLFTYLSFSSYGELIPKNFIFSINIYGERIKPNQMLDSSEFYLNYLEQIKTSLENTEYKNLIEDLFCGKLQEKRICSLCSNTSFKEEEFKSITLEVRNMKDIFQSFDKYFSEEIVDDYNCDKCNNKVKLKKTTIIFSLPNILVIHLNRMKYNNNGELEKISSKFDFPLELDIKKYCVENNNQNELYYKYNLKGINIHKGDADGGHYVSLIQTSKEENKWYLFDDSYVSEYNFNNFEEDFNEKKKNNFAYILFYESIQEKPMKTVFKENLPKEYLIEVLEDNKTYENIYGKKVIDINNELVKIFIDIINNESFKLKEKNVTYYEIRDLINIFIDLIINFYSDENNRKNPEQKDIKNIGNIINKIFLASLREEDILDDSYKTIICKQIKDKLFTDKNIRLLFTKNEIKELNKKLYELIYVIIKKNKKAQNIFSKYGFQEVLNSIINKRKNISIYLYKIFYEIITYYPNSELDRIDVDSFLDLFYKTKEENKENLEEICKIFDYYIMKKNIVGISQTINKVLKDDLSDAFFKILFDYSKDALIKIINQIQYNNKEISDKFNTEIIQKLYTHSLKEKDKDHIRQKQIKLIKIIFAIFEIKDTYCLNRIKLLLGFPTLVMTSSDNIIKKFGINLINNDINKEMYEYSSYNLIKKDNCVLSYLFPSCYYINEENKLEEKDKNDLIYELINISLGLNNNANEGNYFLFKTLYLMQSRSVKYDNLYQEMKCLLEKAKYDLSKIKKAEINAIEFVNYEFYSSMILIKTGNKVNKDNNINKPKLPNIYSKWNKLILDNCNKNHFIGCISNIFPFEVGKIEINMKINEEEFEILRFKFYTTYFTKQELTNLSRENKLFLYENIKRNKPPLNINNSKQEEKTFITDFSIFKETKDVKELMNYITDKIKNNEKVIIENKDILDKYEVKNTFNKYYILSKDKKEVIRCCNKLEGMTIKEINNYYLPEYIYNSFQENQVINLFNVHMLHGEFKFFENNDIALLIELISYENYFNDMLT